MKGLDFLKGFNELAEDIVLEAEKPECYRKPKPYKGNIVKFAGVAAGVAVLVGIVAAKQMGIINSKLEPDTEIETEYSETEYIDKELSTLDLRTCTTLEVVTDRSKFTAVTQDQSYNPETDMNVYSIINKSENFIADAGDTVYIARETGALFAFQKETGSAEIACSKPDCEHDLTTIGGDCEANLHVLDANVGGIQYYKGDLYYTMAGGNSAVLYKMSLNSKLKYKCGSLVGEKGYGGVSWLIHRGYIYFTVGDEGIYKMAVDNPADKELIVRQPGDSFNIQMNASGSYLYFCINSGSEIAIARYNMESEQIEQFTDLQEDIGQFIVKDEKIYFNKTELDSSIVSYNINTGEKEAFLEEHKEKREIHYTILYADADSLYISKVDVERFIPGEPYENNVSPERIYAAYTPRGMLMGKLYYPNTGYDKKLEPLKVFHNEFYEILGSDSDRVYYVGKVYDTQVQEDGVIQKVVEGTEKIVILYTNKSELSPENEAELHVAGEFYFAEPK